MPVCTSLLSWAHLKNLDRVLQNICRTLEVARPRQLGIESMVRADFEWRHLILLDSTDE